MTTIPTSGSSSNNILAAQSIIEQLKKKNLQTREPEVNQVVREEREETVEVGLPLSAKVFSEEIPTEETSNNTLPEIVIEKPFLVADELFVTDFRVGDKIVMKPLKYLVAKHSKAKVTEAPSGHKGTLIEIQYENGLITWCDPKDVSLIAKRIPS